MKLYSNGNLEVCEGVSLTQTEIINDYRFTETLITVPKIIVNTSQVPPISIAPNAITIKGELIGVGDDIDTTLIFRDDFDRANASSLGSDWTLLTSNGYSIASNKAKPTNNNVDSLVVYKDSYSDNVSISVDITPSGVNGVVFRGLNYNNFLSAGFMSGNLALIGKTNNVTQVASQVPFVVQTGNTYRLKVELRGTQIKIYIDDALQITYESNAHIANGRCGFISNSNSSSFDNFEIRQLP